MKNKSNTRVKIGHGIVVLAVLGFFALPVAAQTDTLLQNITIDTPVLTVSERSQVTVSWQQAYDGVIDAMICNLDGKVIRTILKKKRLNAGTHQIQWDGRNDTGEICPNDAYLPIIRIRTARYGNRVYNPSSRPWGSRVTPSNLHYDASQEKIIYTLDQHAMCLIRVGEKDGGPVYKTVLNWEPRDAGNHREPWDGMDITGIVHAAQKAKFDILLDAYALPQGSILIKDSAVHMKSNTIKKQFPIYPPQGENIFLHAFHQKDVRHDMPITATLINPLDSREQIPIVKGDAIFEVGVNEDEDIDDLIREKFEIYVFVDGNLVFENPANTIPTRVRLDTTLYPNGEKVVTMNLRTTEDRVGSVSLKVNIKN